MNINNKIISYDISKQLPQSTQKATEQIEAKQSADLKKVEGTEKTAQDTIVNLSPALKEVQTIKEIIVAEPDVREDKVAELKERIESGRYEIDYPAVADKMVDSFIDEVL